jgi:hypothetical protein
MFCRFPKVSKCVQSLRKRINNSTEPFEDSAFYPLAEPSLTEPFSRFCTAKKLREKIRNLEGSVQNYEGFVPTVNGFVQNRQGSLFSHGTFFAVQNLEKGSVRDGSASR